MRRLLAVLVLAYSSAQADLTFVNDMGGTTGSIELATTNKTVGFRNPPWDFLVDAATGITSFSGLFSSTNPPTVSEFETSIFNAVKIGFPELPEFHLFEIKEISINAKSAKLSIDAFNSATGDKVNLVNGDMQTSPDMNIFQTRSWTLNFNSASDNYYTHLLLYGVVYMNPFDSTRLNPGQSWDIQYDSISMILIPEPSSLSLLVFGGAVLMAGRRRKRD